MYIIGLHNDVDAGVCLIKDGALLEALNEERLNRKKLYQGLPKLSLKYVLKKHNLNLEDIDYFAYGWHGKQNDLSEYVQRLSKRIIYALRNNPACGGVIQERLRVEASRDQETRDKFERWMQRIKIPESKIVYLDHHKSHAWSAFAPSPFEEAFVFTFDGRGDLKSATASFATRKDGIKECDYLLSFDSLGFLYGQITHYLGFIPHRHEGKITGLAAYGNPDITLPLFKRLVDWANNTIISNLGFFRPFYTNLGPALIKELSKFSREDIAAGLQRHCENMVLEYINHWIKVMDRPGVKNVALAGGLFANVRLNQRIAEIENVKNVYVFPHMGDGGLFVGSACYLNYMLTGQSKIEWSDVYFGPSYANPEILESTKLYSDRIKYKKMEDKIRGTVGYLMDKKLVGYFDNKMEFGPRALGARSILYHARDEHAKEMLNIRLKRTEFMPLAPVTPMEYADKCYINWRKDDICSRFMTMAYNCTEAFKKVHKAVVHVDGTARPQIVSEGLNGDYYKIVKSYCDRTGEKALVNTSFNQHEEPIVCTPENAIKSLLNNSVDILIMGDYEVVRR